MALLDTAAGSSPAGRVAAALSGYSHASALRSRSFTPTEGGNPSGPVLAMVCLIGCDIQATRNHGGGEVAARHTHRHSARAGHRRRARSASGRVGVVDRTSLAAP